MIVMLDFIWLCLAVRNGKQSKNVYLHRESNQRSLAFQPSALDHSAMPTVDEMLNTLTIYWHMNKINTRLNACNKLIMVWSVHTKFCKQ